MKLFSFVWRRFLTFRREAVVLWFAFRDPRTPRPLRIASLLAGLYLLSPIDLIPITIPLFGLLDDLVIVPAAVSQIARRLPQGVYADSGHKADQWISRWFKRPLLAVAVILGVLVAVWIGVLWLLWRLIFG